MANMINASKLSKDKYVPVVLARDVRRASIANGKRDKVAVLSPLGFVEEIPRQRLLSEYRRLDGKKIRMMAWRTGQKYLVCLGKNEMWYAMYVPKGRNVYVVYPDGAGRIANKNGPEHGDYVVCPADGTGAPDTSRMYIVANSWFHKMFRFTPKAVEIAKNMLAGCQVDKVTTANTEDGAASGSWSTFMGEPGGQSDGTGFDVSSAAEPQEPRRITHQERVARSQEMEKAGWAKVHYPDIYGETTGGDTRASSEPKQAIMRKYVTGSPRVEFFIPADGKVETLGLKMWDIEEFEKRYRIKGAKATNRLMDKSGKLIGVVLVYSDGSGSAESSLKEAAMLARLGLIDNLVVRVNNGHNYLCGKGGTKLSELPAIVR